MSEKRFGVRVVIDDMPEDVARLKQARKKPRSVLADPSAYSEREAIIRATELTTRAKGVARYIPQEIR